MIALPLAYYSSQSATSVLGRVAALSRAKGADLFHPCLLFHSDSGFESRHGQLSYDLFTLRLVRSWPQSTV
jgi:hypothetical protein